MAQRPRSSMPTPQPPVSDERWRRRIRLAGLESDLAYFQARLAMIGEPASINQLAQRRVFNLLHEATGGSIVRAKLEIARSR